MEAIEQYYKLTALQQSRFVSPLKKASNIRFLLNVKELEEWHLHEFIHQNPHQPS